MWICFGIFCLVGFSDRVDPGLPVFQEELVDWHGTIRAGDQLGFLLTSNGVSAAEACEASRILGEHLPLRRLPLGLQYRVIHNAEETSLSWIFETSSFEWVVLDIRPNLRVRVIQRQPQLQEQVARGAIRSSLSEAFAGQGLSPLMVQSVESLFANQVSFRRVPAGSRYELVYESLILDGEPVGTGRVLAARLTVAGDSFSAFYFSIAQGGGYFDEQGQTLLRGFLPAPVNVYQITSPYSKNRFHPVQKRYKPHLGTDYAAAKGAPVHAMADGQIEAATYSEFNGNFVKIRHDAIYETQYLHMCRLASLKPGQKVKRGQVIGYVGDTGLADGVHLCYRLWKNGKQVDPRQHQPRLGLAESAGSGFQAEANRLRALLDGHGISSQLN
ncbi:MAG: peptidoglycan DD-metalloendopeptidase family protein [Acidobacteria bacterium]|nr:peptidoglycan DD-metalloendopeptidase family protein [Acidobacteriota bacterium]